MHGWLPFAALRGVTQKTILGELSYIWTRVLRKFFNPEGFNFELGMRLACANRDALFRIKLKCGPMCQDLKAHQNSFGTKGPNGTQNVVRNAKLC